MTYIRQAFIWLNDPLNWTNPGGILDSLRQHLVLTILSLLLAAAVALPIGLWFGHTGRGGGLVVALANMTRAIPTIGLLTIFGISSLGLGARSAVPALAIFAIPVILANTYTGMREVDPDARDAARGMGMSGGQMLRQVELPMAMPYIMTGLRSAAVQVVATATLGAIVADGGLGTIISAGFGLSIAKGGGQVVAGGLLVVILALAVNAVMGVIAHYATPPPLRERPTLLPRFGRRGRPLDAPQVTI
jgi:osmoprotectant transport system permease protein